MPRETIKIAIEGTDKVEEFPVGTPWSDIKAYLDAKYGSAPERTGPLLKDIAGAVTEPVARIHERMTSPEKSQGTAGDLAGNFLDILGIIGSPFEATGRVFQRAAEQAPTLVGGEPRSSAASQAAYWIGALLGPALILKGAKKTGEALAKRLKSEAEWTPLVPRPPKPSVPEPAAAPQAPPVKPQLALPPIGGTTPSEVRPTRVFQQSVGPKLSSELRYEPLEIYPTLVQTLESGLAAKPLPGIGTGFRTKMVPLDSAEAEILLQAVRGAKPGKSKPPARAPQPAPEPAAPGPKPGLKSGTPAAPGPRQAPKPEAASPGLSRSLSGELSQSYPGRRLSPQRSLLAALTDSVGNVFKTVYSAMEAISPEGAEVARRLRLVTTETMLGMGRIIQPLADTLRGLSSAQRRELFLALHEGKPITSPAVRDAYAAFMSVFGAGQGVLPAAMAKAGLKLYKREGGRLVPVGPFQARESFFPLEYPTAFKLKLLESPKFRAARAAELVASGQAKTLAEARQILRTFIEGRRVYRTRLSPGEFVREYALPGFIEDPLEAAVLRGWKTLRRLAELKHLGPRDEEIRRLVEALRERRPAAAERLEFLVDVALGGQRGMLTRIDRRIGRLVRGLRTAQAVFKLPLAVIANTTQSLWTSFRTNAAVTTLAFMKAVFKTRESIEAAKALGAYSDIAARQILAEYAASTTGRFADIILRPFNAAEKFNRLVAANAGTAWANSLERKLASGSGGGWLRREFARLGFSEPEISQIFARKSLTPHDKSRIALEIVDQTQFIPSRGGRSVFFNTETGMLLGQFKTFSMNLGRMLYRTVIDELRAGNIKPAVRLLMYALPMAAVGEIVADLRAVLTGRQRPSLETEFAARTLENLLSIGGIGIATDFLFSVGQGQGILGWISGPTLDDAQRFIDRLMGIGLSQIPEETARQNTEMLRFMLKRIPYIGPPLTGYVIPPTIRTRPKYGPTLSDQLGISPRANAEARERAYKLLEQQRTRWQNYLSRH